MKPNESQRGCGSPGSAGKRCPRCGHAKPLSDFYANSSKPDGHSPRCKDCDRRRRTESYHANRAQDMARTRARRLADPERERTRRRQQYERHGDAERAAARVSARARYAELRKAVFDHYGRICRCCGSADRLTIDHVNGDGREHRQRIGRGATAIYRWLVQNGFPVGYQTLCMPCNQSKRNGTLCRLAHAEVGS